MPKWNDSVTKSWSHLQTSYPSQKKLSEVLLDRQKQQDREQQSKQGDYIPLTAQSGEPKPSRSWEDWGNAVDETMARTFNPSGEVYTQPFVATEEKVGYAEAKENSKMHNGNPWITSVPTPKLEHMPASRVAKGRQKLAETYDIDYDDYSEDRAERRRRRKNKELKKKAKAAAPTPIYLPEFISVANLATALHVSPEQFEAKLLELGFEETSYDHIVDGETAGLIAQEFSFEPRYDNQEDARDILPRPPVEDMSVLPQRPPIITIMGHVDHGKTTILDSLRKSSVVASEFGGITQHIGAFSVKMPSGKTMTFLDTPGHAAFLSMRQRGANVTDIVILVVAADDSVMPQTIEAINHAKAANVPILLAINKIDKEEADPERVKQDLAKYGVVVEDYGGDTQAVCISGKTGEGMHDLEEATMLLAEMQDMRAEQDGLAEGWIIEATTKKGGRVATVLVRRGTMRSGDVIVAGTTWGRIRTLKNEAGVEVPAAGPGTPVEVDGWKDQPVAGDEVLQAPDEQKAKSSIDYRREKASLVKLSEDTAAINEQRAEERSERDREKREKELAENEDSIEEISAQPSITETSERSGMKEVYFIVKGDVSGSVEAVVNSVCGVGNEEVRPHIIRSGVGSVTEFDIEHAATANGCILAFNVDVDPHVRSLAETSGVKILDHNIIYKLVDDVKAKLSEQLKPRITKSVLGEAEIGQIFQINLKGREFKNVAGCKVRTGLIMRNRKVKVQRGDEIVFDGSLSSLKNVKKDVLEVRRGTECGVSFEKWEDFQIGDQIQCYEEKSEKRSL
ncbi:MAG: hypothetical protein M1834_008746 [Cirrosporium novae-zelandiae]|nr:MAG: hypothetical protein M1834_008746 [Cirrosporium novae-zelandiae]